MKKSKEAFIKAILHGLVDSYYIDKYGNVRTKHATVKYGTVVVRDGAFRKKFTVNQFMCYLARIMRVNPTYDNVRLGLDSCANVLAEMEK